MDDRARKWIAAEFPSSSEQIKAKKDEINGTNAHANFWSSHMNFRHEPDTGILHLPYFDLEDHGATIVELASCGQIGLICIDLIVAVNEKHGEIALPPDTISRWSNQTHVNDLILQELMKQPRWIQAVRANLDK